MDLRAEWERRDEAWKERENKLTRKTHSNQIQLQRLLKIHDWGHECILTLAEADHLCLFATSKLNQIEFAKRRTELLRRLSALVDQGRIFFKNEEIEDYGSEKLPAYQGLRPKILDPLIATYMAIEVLHHVDELPDNSRIERLFRWRQYFVSVLQKELNPEWIQEATLYSQVSGGGAGSSIDKNSEAPCSI